MPERAKGQSTPTWKDRQEAEQTLRKCEERYRAFLEHSSEGVWCVDIHPSCLLSRSVKDQIEHTYEHGYLTECNDVMARMFGFSNAAELARSVRPAGN